MGSASKVPTDPGMSTEVRAFLDTAQKQVDDLAATALTLGTAAFIDVGTGASKVVQMTAAAKLPAVDGSLLTSLPAQSGLLTAGTPLVLNPYVTSNSTSQAHGLGAAPIMAVAVFECLSADLNYSAGDKILVPAGQSNYINVLFDATNTYLITNNTTPTHINKTTFAYGVSTTTKWKLTVTPYKLT